MNPYQPTPDRRSIPGAAGKPSGYPPSADAGIAVDSDADLPVLHNDDVPDWPAADAGDVVPDTPVDFSTLPVEAVIQGCPILAVPLDQLARARLDARMADPGSNHFLLIASELVDLMRRLRLHLRRDACIVRTVPRSRSSTWSARYREYRNGPEVWIELPVADRQQAALAKELLRSWRPKRPRGRGSRGGLPRLHRRCRRHRDPNVEPPWRE